MNPDGSEMAQVQLLGSNQEGIEVGGNCTDGMDVVIAEDHASAPAVRKYAYLAGPCGEEGPDPPGEASPNPPEAEEGGGNPPPPSSVDEPDAVQGPAAGVIGLSGDGQVALSWVAPSVAGSAGVTDYVVEYSSDGGGSWSVFADGASASTTATVTGLSNGTSYVFRVSAVNAAGTGAVSVVSGVVAPWWSAPAGCTIVGTPGDDVLVGTSGDDHICGLGGDDTIYGKGGNDTLDGGPGNDTLYGGTGKDRLFGRGGADVLKGGRNNDKLYGNGGRDRLYGQSGNDKLAGGRKRDKLYGQGGKDKLYGGNARDLLVGGAMKDTLDGGSQKDTAKKPGPDVLVSIEIIVP